MLQLFSFCKPFALDSNAWVQNYLTFDLVWRYFKSDYYRINLSTSN